MDEVRYPEEFFVVDVQRDPTTGILYHQFIRGPLDSEAQARDQLAILKGKGMAGADAHIRMQRRIA